MENRTEDRSPILLQVTISLESNGIGMDVSCPSMVTRAIIETLHSNAHVDWCIRTARALSPILEKASDEMLAIMSAANAEQKQKVALESMMETAYEKIKKERGTQE